MKLITIPLVQSSSLLFCFALVPLPAVAQVMPDGTTSTKVIPDGNDNFTINDGDRAGGNLFHSFQDFSVPTNGSAFFNNALDIDNIISRVTGGSISNIDGLIRANGSANLFLINPAGIIFGAGARLDIGGSFLGSTADSILFPDDMAFSASDLQPPLLTINAPIGLGIRDNPGDIVNNSVADGVGLLVNQGEKISLIGGNVSVANGGIIFAPGGRIELGGLIETGTINFNNDGSLSFPENINRGNVSLTDVSIVAVFLDGDGSITVNANNLEILDGSLIVAGIGQGLGTVESQAGDITLNTEAVSIGGTGSGVFNNVQQGGIGNAGNITITTNSLSLTNGAQVDASTFSEGNAGNITITASEEVSIDGVGTNNLSSGIFSNLQQGGIGNAGNIELTTANLSISNGGAINSITGGQGNAGNITINAFEEVSIDGVGTNNFSSGIFSNNQEGVGNAGNIELTTANLALTNGSSISSSTFGQGNAGSIKIEASDTVSISGFILREDSSEVISAIGTVVGLIPEEQATEVRQGGDIDIRARNLALDNSGSISASTDDQGNAGSIELNVSELISLSNNGRILSGVGQNALGRGGNIIITADSLSLSNSSGIANETSGRESNGIRSDAGDIEINVVESLELTGGSFLQSDTFGQGDAGNIDITTTNLFLTDDSLISSSVNRQENLLGRGTGGNIDIEAQSLFLTNGAQVGASTIGEGDAGNITITASEEISIEGVGTNNSGILSNNQGGIGNAGNIEITTANLSVSNGGAISSNTIGQGNAGNVKIEANDTVSISGFTLREDGLQFSSAIVTIVGLIQEEQGIEVRQGGDIDIRARNLALDNSGSISASTFGQGNAGNIFINVDESITLFNSGNISTNVGREGVGNAGDINIQARSLTLRSGGQIGTAVFRSGFDISGGEGTGGNIQINTTDFVDISGVSTVQLNILDISGDPNNTIGLIPTEGFSSGLIANSERGASGDAGNITVNTDVFRIADGAVVDSLTANEGNGGNITINANNFAATGGGQVLTTTRGSGNAGSIQLNIADSISISGSDPNFESRLARANEFGLFQGGDNIVNNQGAESGIFANTESGSTGDGGSIAIGVFSQEDNKLVIDPTQSTNEITLADNGIIAADSQGEGNGGSISIRAEDLTLDNQAEILAATSSLQEENINPSEIILEIKDILQLRNGSTISAQAFADANGGNVTIDADLIIASLNQNNDIIANALQGQGGNIIIDTEGVFGLEARSSNPDNETNDIDASGSVDGEVIINTRDDNILQEAIETPEIVETETLGANVCSNLRGAGNSSFTITGKGGVPPELTEPLISDSIHIEGENVTSEIEKEETEEEVKTFRLADVVPARGMIIKENGDVILTAYPTDNVQRTPHSSANCGQS